MTLLNHLFTNTISLPPHHHIHFLNSKKNMSQNRTHFPQNLSRANPSLPTEHHPNNSPGRKKCVAKSDTFSSKSLAFCMEYPHRGTPYTAGGLDYVVKSHKGASIFSLIKPAIGVSRVVAGLGGRRQFQWMECIDHHR